MAQEPLTYDLMLLLDNEAADDVRARVLADAERIISAGGSVVGDYDWGNRQLSYEIEHKDAATYHLVQFQGGTDVINDLNRTLSIADGLVRYRIIKLKPGTPAPPSATAEAEQPAVPA